MNLHEEYFARHRIDAPLIKIVDKANLIFKSTGKGRSPWAIFQITLNKADGANHPHKFNFVLSEPMHDGCEKSNFVKNVNEKCVDFDSYELEIIDQGSKMSGFDPIVDLAEAKMACWEMFLFCNDYRLSQIPVRLQPALRESINLDLTIEERMTAHEKIVMSLQRSPLLSKWESIKQYCCPLFYADWYAKVIHDLRNKSYYRAKFADIKCLA